MLSVTTSQPVHWPLSPSPAVSPVTPVGAVAPVQSQTRDQASGFGSGREGRAGTAPDTPQDRRASTDKVMPQAMAAPILPREQPEGGQRGETSSVADAALAQKQAREAQVQAEEKAAQQPQLQEVLSTVWKASAAVVDAILGRDAGVGNVSQGASLDAAVALPGSSRAVTAEGAPVVTRSQTPQPAADAPAPLADRIASEPVTYNDQGASVWGAIETGTRLNQTV
ncbi:hypothetical protein [Hydrogenophaga sp. PAMC20947]|uniref:hypothetical protein n=1 Tax=Hydrogenophaga sp. PAMC20947 TaxID=2565558 RepID=UPI00109D8FD9|nr:hypothetical protein [Hydrogenophaga sp. PAMC20947]QCB46842.1 hypothetical protein E5678_12915 [Hydrogenophaga sp. PAMC20947]